MAISSNRLAKAKPVQPDSFVFSKLVRLAPFSRRVEPERPNYLWIWFLTQTLLLFVLRIVSKMKCAWVQIGWPGPDGPRARVGTGARAKAGAGGSSTAGINIKLRYGARFGHLSLMSEWKLVGLLTQQMSWLHSVFSLFVLGVGWGAGGRDT